MPLLLQILILWFLASIALGLLIGAAIPRSDDDILELTADDLADRHPWAAQQAARSQGGGGAGGNARDLAGFSKLSHHGEAPSR